MYYDLLKSFHLIAVISWMVGLLYLPRLFVYHNETKFKSESDITFLLMELRLNKFIMTPAMALTYIFGFILLYNQNYFLFEYYFIIKLGLVILLTAFHVYLSMLYIDFKKGYRNRVTFFYKVINEVPTVLMIFIVILIIVKPNFSPNL
ncbi:MAG: protoporphyrinogen oxidase HemJ [Proteobacteria bacterium]|nr:protoporphyrinogen oxidase HemJ [Pseudomonadota bacterium]MDA1135494.1 protoporphyrinogen oxidase HemJ [Pseudomonadota bacterium]